MANKKQTLFFALCSPVGLARVARASYIDKNGRFRKFDGALIHRNRLTSFEQVLNVEINSLADICECFRPGHPRIYRARWPL